jgi:hypothetical protein
VPGVQATCGEVHGRTGHTGQGCDAPLDGRRAARAVHPLDVHDGPL